MVQPNRGRRLRGISTPSFLYILSWCNFVLVGVALIIDIVCLVDIHHRFHRNPGDSYTGSALTGTILVILHLIVMIIQLYYGFRLYDGVKNRDVEKCKSWFLQAINSIGSELLIIVPFTFIGPEISYFISYSLAGILYKFFQLWPVDSFIDDIENYSEPLMGNDSEFHI